jgi:hypothetical protein
MTADSLQLTAYGLGRMPCPKHVGAVSRRPMAERDLPKAKPPRVRADLRPTASSSKRADGELAARPLAVDCARRKLLLSCVGIGKAGALLPQSKEASPRRQQNLTASSPAHCFDSRTFASIIAIHA